MRSSRAGIATCLESIRNYANGARGDNLWEVVEREQRTGLPFNSSSDNRKELEARLKLVESEVKGQLDLSQFYLKPENLPRRPAGEHED